MRLRVPKVCFDSLSDWARGLSTGICTDNLEGFLLTLLGSGFSTVS